MLDEQLVLECGLLAREVGDPADDAVDDRGIGGLLVLDPFGQATGKAEGVDRPALAQTLVV